MKQLFAFLICLSGFTAFAQSEEPFSTDCLEADSYEEVGINQQGYEDEFPSHHEEVFYEEDFYGEEGEITQYQEVSN
jgi:hypothetical protein